MGDLNPHQAYTLNNSDPLGNKGEVPWKNKSIDKHFSMMDYFAVISHPN